MVEDPASHVGGQLGSLVESPSLGSEWIVQATHGLQSPSLLSLGKIFSCLQKFPMFVPPSFLAGLPD